MAEEEAARRGGARRTTARTRAGEDDRVRLRSPPAPGCALGLDARLGWEELTEAVRPRDFGMAEVLANRTARRPLRAHAAGWPVARPGAALTPEGRPDGKASLTRLPCKLSDGRVGPGRTKPLRAGCRGSWPVVEQSRELLDDAVREHVGHAERLHVNLVVGRDVGRPVAVEAGERLLGREARCSCSIDFISPGPHEPGFAPARNAAISSAFAVQRVDVGNCGLVAGLRRGDQVCRDQDVLAEEPRQLLSGSVAVEGLDRVADVGLVPEQPPDGRLGVGRAGGEADDRQARPGDVVSRDGASRRGTRRASA